MLNSIESMFSRRVENNSTDFVVLFFTSSILEISRKRFLLEYHTKLVGIVVVSNINSSIFFSCFRSSSFSVLVETTHVISISTVTFIPEFSISHDNIDWGLLFTITS